MLAVPRNESIDEALVRVDEPDRDEVQSDECSGQYMPAARPGVVFGGSKSSTGTYAPLERRRCDRSFCRRTVRPL